jgi:hypothetical protein
LGRLSGVLTFAHCRDFGFLGMKTKELISCAESQCFFFETVSSQFCTSCHIHKFSPEKLSCIFNIGKLLLGGTPEFLQHDAACLPGCVIASPAKRGYVNRKQQL